MSITCGLWYTVMLSNGGSLNLCPCVQYVRSEKDRIENLDASSVDHLFRRSGSAKKSGSANLLHCRKRNRAILSLKDINPEVENSLLSWLSNRGVAQPASVESVLAGDTGWKQDKWQGHAACVVVDNTAYTLYAYPGWRSCKIAQFGTVRYWRDGSREFYSYYSGSHEFRAQLSGEDSPTGLIVRFGSELQKYVTKTEVMASRYYPGSAWINSMIPWDARRAQISDFSFADGLRQCFESYEELGVIYAQPATSQGFAAAYQAAVGNLPEAKANAIANLMQVAGELASLLRKPRIDKPSLSDEWLKYRYVHNTTRSDLEEYSTLARRVCDLAEQASADAIVHGTVTINNVRYRCVARFPVADILPKNMKGVLNQFNLRLSAYNLWDLVPYSFIVDWFLPIGDWLAMLDNYARSLRFEPGDVWYSAYQALDTEEAWFDVYLRLLSRGANRNLPAFTTREVSGKTLIQRIADTAAITFSLL